MATKAKEKFPRGRPPGQSEWSPEVTHVVRVPGRLFVDATPSGADRIDVKWKLPAEDESWAFGTDVEYQLMQIGSCPRHKEGTHQPVTKNNLPV